MTGAAILGFISVQAAAVDLGNGVGIALVGMTTVFVGLVVLALILPALKKWVEDRFGLAKGEDSQELETKREMTREELAAVSAALHAHFCLLDQVENMKLTWESYEKPYTPWRLAGRAEHLQESGSLQNRIRRN
ncbi:MAG: hypothetical protein GF388_07100 [Candidatus Aegiribacteria sp.]|nr:hypothetical protein [Candidatus Aegiribacteria sp.]MBD3294900.1 hypothetical protein [Candidatus Fermentibacteria bacterium]